MDIGSVLVFLFLAFVTFVVFRVIFPPLIGERTAERRTGRTKRDPFHAVAIRPGPAPCNAVVAIQSKRFLSDVAPALPLAECGSAACRCKYEHYMDRRGEQSDRRIGRTLVAEVAEFWSRRERRRAEGRRQDDMQAA